MRRRRLRHRARPGRAAARPLLRRSRPERPRHRQRPRAPGGAARGACPSARTAPRRSSSAFAAGTLRRARLPPTPRARAHRAHARHAVVLATSRSTCATSARCSTTCCAVLEQGHALDLRSTVAPGTTEFVAGYLEKHRGFTIGEDVFVAHVPERIAAGRFFEEIGTLPCIVGGVGERSGERRRGPLRGASARRSCRRRRCRPSWPRSGRTSCATRVRAAQPADDGLRAVRRERLRGHRPHQPRLSARRDGDARADGRHLPAQGLRLLRGAIQRAGHAAGGLARQRDGAALPRPGHEAAAGPLHGRKVAVLGLAFKRAPTTSATRWRTSSSACSSASWPTSSSTTRTSRRRRRRSRRPSRTPTWWSWPPTTPSSPPRDARGAAAPGAPRLPGGRPLERLRRRPGVRLRERDRAAVGGLRLDQDANCDGEQRSVDSKRDADTNERPLGAHQSQQGAAPTRPSRARRRDLEPPEGKKPKKKL